MTQEARTTKSAPKNDKLVQDFTKKTLEKVEFLKLNPMEARFYRMGISDGLDFAQQILNDNVKKNGN